MVELFGLSDRKTELWPGKINTPADYSSRLYLGSPVQPRYDEGGLACTIVSTDDFSELNLHLVSVAACLNGLSVDHLDSETGRKTRQNYKRLAAWNGSLFRWAGGSLRLIPQKHVKCLNLKSYHEDTTHWNKKETLTLAADCLWWPPMW